MSQVLIRTMPLFAFLFLGCSSLSVKNYASETPALKLEEFFNGDIDAYGIFQDRQGRVVKRFYVYIKANWVGDIGTLDESFEYSDGTRSKRVWTLVRRGGNVYSGTASDVVGEARGEVAGNAFSWKYVLNLEVGESHYHVKFDDWMFLMSDKIMLNKAKMTKLGIDLGEVTLTFVRR
jgi:hypothetical protein